MRKWLKALNALDQYIQEHIEGDQETLRERQISVFGDLRDFLEAGGKEGYIKLPTGVGKTVLFTELIEALDLKTLIVVPTTLLIGQTEEKIGEFAADLEVGAVYGEAKQYGEKVTITTYDSFVSQVKSGKINPDDYDCLILDEVHVSLSEKRMKTVQKFDKAIKLGFTATPEFSSRKKVSDLLENEIHRMDIREAVEEGLISSLSALIAKTEVDLSKVDVDKKGAFVEESLEKAVNVAGRNKSAVELYKKNFSGELAVVYCVGIKHAQAVAAKFNQEGVPAAHISGEMSPKVQAAILRKYKSGEIKVLCNADLLIAGFDEPKASICLNLRPTKSRVVAEQRGGRVLRLDPNNKNKHAFIIDFLDKGIDPQQKPVFFSSIIQGVHIKTRSRQTGKTGKGGEHGEFPIIDVPGLEVITDVEEVMQIINEKGGSFKQGIFEEDGDRWGTIGAYVEFFNSNYPVRVDNRTIERRIIEGKCSKKEGKGHRGQKRIFYAFSEVWEACKEIVDKSLPIANEEGFFTEGKEKYGMITSWARELTISRPTLRTRLEGSPYKYGKDVTGEKQKFFVYSSIEKACPDLLGVENQAGKNGTFKAQGEIWGTKISLGVKLGINRKTIDAHIDQSVRTCKGRDSWGKVQTFYSLIDVKRVCSNAVGKKK